jgi:hypothetical protein
MNANDAKKSADDYHVKQAVLMDEYISQSISFSLKRINSRATEGCYDFYLTSTFLKTNPQAVIPSNKEEEVLARVAKTLDDEYGYSVCKNKVDSRYFEQGYTIKWK